MKKVLISTFTMDVGGLENFLMNIVKNIDKEKFEIHFTLNQLPKNKKNLDVLNRLGVKYHVIGNLKPNPIKFCENYSKVLDVYGPFDAVHINLEQMGGIPAAIARKKGVNNRYVHTHTTNLNAFHNRILLPFYRYLINKNATGLLACGDEAGKYIFGNDKKFHVIKNGLNINEFLNDKNKVRSYRIAQVGRLSQEKNQMFSLDLISKLDKKYTLDFYGEGDFLDELKCYSDKIYVSNRVNFKGLATDVAKVYSKYDFIILPSLFEGVPFVLIEAQASGCHAFVSSNVSTESDLGLSLLTFLDLDVDDWVSEISEYIITKPSMESITCAFEKNGYNIISTIKVLERLYEK